MQMHLLTTSSGDGCSRMWSLMHHPYFLLLKWLQVTNKKVWLQQ